MSASEPGPTSLDRLRERARERVERTSLRAVARAVGMSPKALEGFLAGDPIRSASRRKLFAWLMDTDLEADERGAQRVRLLQTLVADLPEGRQLPALVRLLEAIRHEFDPEAGAPVPLWLSRITEKVGAYADDLEQASNRADADPNEYEGENENAAPEAGDPRV